MMEEMDDQEMFSEMADGDMMKEEESKPRPQQQAAFAKVEPPKSATFKELIGHQHSSGFWPEACKQMLNTFIKSGDCTVGLESIVAQLKALTVSQ
jgi:hypothetical protein